MTDALNTKALSREDEDTAEWIRACEADFRKRVVGIAENICSEAGLKVVCLFGPTCAGKTTASKILVDIFESFGKRAHIVSLDDFFLDIDILEELSKEQGLGELDYDSPNTLDYDELGRFVDQIFTSNEARCPIFDFTTGRRNGHKTFLIDDKDIFIFEGI